MHQIQVVGNITHDPDQIRYAGEHPVLNVSIAVNRREKVRGEWQDGEPTFYRLNLWRDTAMNAAETLRKGMQVIVIGTVKTSTWEKDGEKRSSQDIDVDTIGPSLRFQTAQVQRANRQQGGAQQPTQQSYGGTQQADPWAGQPQGQGGWDTPQGDKPPF